MTALPGPALTIAGRDGGGPRPPRHGERVLFSYLRQQGAQPLSGTTSTVLI